MSSEKALMVVTAMVYADSGEKETLDNEFFSSKKGVIIINFCCRIIWIYLHPSDVVS